MRGSLEKQLALAFAFLLLVGISVVSYWSTTGAPPSIW